MDKLTAFRRSENMRQIKSKGMKPEMAVRSLVHGMGFRFRLHVKDLPGKPDLVFPSRRKIIFVHGCFWHQHSDPLCLDGRMPSSRLEYWKPKLERNRARDLEHQEALTVGGWDVMVIWECETRRPEALAQLIKQFFDS